jgi:secreted PhoX family phosphatase
VNNNKYTSQHNFEKLVQARLSRRQLLKGSLGLALNAAFFNTASARSQNSIPSIFEQLNFQAIPAAYLKDQVIVPKGYTATVLYPWGETIKHGVAAFKEDASNTAAEQALQAGMHHDGMSFFPLPKGSQNSTHGLLVMNHEYIDATLLHTEGGFRDNPEKYSREKTDKEIAAHGASIIEIKYVDNRWKINKNSDYARRITTATPMRFTGSATGSTLLKTNADPKGKYPIGMNANCANGMTPWGTYLSCEENFQTIFGGVNEETQLSPALTKLHKRYGIRRKNSYYGWDTQYERFSVAKEPHEANRFGWIVEIDPFNPNSIPKKHTAMGRFRHENCVHMIGDNNQIAFYSGDDAQFEYIYKFVPSQMYDPNNQAKNRALLEAGTLYVARFNADGSGKWLALQYGKQGLTAKNGFANQAEVLVKTRLAADHVGATAMDRPEWIAVDPNTKRLYCTLSNNSKRTETQTHPACPRSSNKHGHIIRWQEHNNDPSATHFTWDVFLLAGDPQSSEDNLKGDIKGDIFSSPDGLFIDPRGALWIQTDISSGYQNAGEYQRFGNNQLLVADPNSKEVRRFLTGPIGAEITGFTLTPDMKHAFVNIQHPGDVTGALKHKVKKTYRNPAAASTWPASKTGKRPRSATVVISKNDGGLIGT